MGGKIATDDAYALKQIRACIRDVPNFPKPGILFKDITPLLATPRWYRASVRLLAEMCHEYKAKGIVAIESRGFLFGAGIAERLGLPLHLVRKAGKLPYKVAGYDYELEYGTDRLEIHIDCIERGKRYLIIDDLLATGGTAAAAAQLVEQQGAKVAECAFVIELAALEGRAKLSWPIFALLSM